jgi:carboxylesterase type B
LQEIDATTFQEAARSLKMAYPNGDNPPIYFWNPTLDHDFVKDYTYNEIRAGNFLKVPSIFGDTANEGQVFIPKTVTSRQQAEQFLSDQFSNLGDEEKASMLRIWQSDTATAGPNPDAKWKEIASDIYGHIRYTCGTLNISAALAGNGSAPTWQYRWNVGTALHVSELSSIWNNGTSASAVFMQGYFASFVRSYDPNKYMTEFLLPKNVEMESPQWEEFGVPAGQNGQKRMVFGNDNVVAMKEVSTEERTKCDALIAMGIQLDQ